MARSDQLHLTVSPGIGTHPAAWQVNSHDRFDLYSAEYWRGLIETAERAAFDAVFIADIPVLNSPRFGGGGSLEPTVNWAHLIEASTSIGFVATASTTLNDPFELAERFETLNALSKGRIAWNVVTNWDLKVSANFGLNELPDREARYGRAGEFVDVVRELFSSSVSGAEVDYRGQYLALRGRLRVPRVAEERVVMFQAGGSPQGNQLAARIADAVFASENNFAQAQERYAALKSSVEAAGRPASALKYLPAIRPFLASTETEARRGVEELAERDGSPVDGEIAYLQKLFGVDVSSYDLDEHFPPVFFEPVEDESSYAGSLGFRATVQRDLVDNNYTIGEYLAKIRYRGGHHRDFVGTPEQLADELEIWFQGYALDGANFMPYTLPDQLDILADEVVPILRKRGLFRSEYSSSRLSENLLS